MLVQRRANTFRVPKVSCCLLALSTAAVFVRCPMYLDGYTFHQRKLQAVIRITGGGHDQLKLIQA